MDEQQFVGSAFIAINSYRRAASQGLEVLPRVDEAIRDFVSTFYSLRFKIEARWDCTTDQFGDRLKEFLEGFKRGGRTSGKYAVFVFVGHGGDGDVLYMEDGKTFTTEEVVKSFAAELPKTVLKMFFIDACRKAGEESAASPYCPAEEKCLLARSALPYQHAWTRDSYGVWSKTLSKQLLSSATVQSALTAVCNTLKQKFDLPEHYHSQYTSYGFPEVAWIADVEYEGGFRGQPALEDLRELTAFRIELERYREAKAQQERQCQRQMQTSVLRLPSDSKDVLQHKPSLEELVQLVITSVAYRWEDVAMFMDVSPSVTDNIKACDRNTSEDHCKEMLKQWLRTTPDNDMMGRMPRTWKSIFHAISNSSGSEVAKDLEGKLFPDITPEYLERTPNLKLLRSHIIPRVTAQWQKFGLFLGIDQAKLDTLVKPSNHNGVTVWCEEMFKLWLKGESDTGDEPRTWESVLGAVTDAIGGGVAKEIERKLRDPDVDIN